MVNKTWHYPFIQQTSYPSFSGRAEICRVWDIMRKRPLGRSLGWFGWNMEKESCFFTAGKVQKAELGLRNNLGNSSLLSNAAGEWCRAESYLAEIICLRFVLASLGVRSWGTGTLWGCGTISLCPAGFLPAALRWDRTCHTGSCDPGDVGKPPATFHIQHSPPGWRRTFEMLSATLRIFSALKFSVPKRLAGGQEWIGSSVMTFTLSCHCSPYLSRSSTQISRDVAILLQNPSPPLYLPGLLCKSWCWSGSPAVAQRSLLTTLNLYFPLFSQQVPVQEGCSLYDNSYAAGQCSLEKELALKCTQE